MSAKTTQSLCKEDGHKLVTIFQNMITNPGKKKYRCLNINKFDQIFYNGFRCLEILQMLGFEYADSQQVKLVFVGSKDGFSSLKSDMGVQMSVENSLWLKLIELAKQARQESNNSCVDDKKTDTVKQPDGDHDRLGIYDLKIASMKYKVPDEARIEIYQNCLHQGVSKEVFQKRVMELEGYLAEKYKTPMSHPMNRRVALMKRNRVNLAKDVNDPRWYAVQNASKTYYVEKDFRIQPHVFMDQYKTTEKPNMTAWKGTIVHDKESAQNWLKDNLNVKDCDNLRIIINLEDRQIYEVKCPYTKDNNYLTIGDLKQILFEISNRYFHQHCSKSIAFGFNSIRFGMKSIFNQKSNNNSYFALEKVLSLNSDKDFIPYYVDFCNDITVRYSNIRVEIPFRKYIAGSENSSATAFNFHDIPLQSCFELVGNISVPCEENLACFDHYVGNRGSRDDTRMMSALIKEVEANGYQSDLDLIHLLDQKMNHVRHLNMLSPLMRCEMFSMILFVNGKCSCDLIISQTQMNVQSKWFVFDLLLNNAIVKLYDQQRHWYVYCVLPNILFTMESLEKKRILYLKTNMVVTYDKHHAVSLLGDTGGVIVGVKSHNYVSSKIGKFHDCDTSWIVKDDFVGHATGVLRRGSCLFLYNDKDSFQERKLGTQQLQFFLCQRYDSLYRAWNHF